MVLEETNFIRRRVVGPVLQLLRIGATPERLAWSIAVGVVIGVNPLLGSTTVLALAVTPLFRLNVVASQFGNHLVYPLELLLFPVFIRVGSLLFRTERMPLELPAIFHAVKTASLADDPAAVELGVACAGGVDHGGGGCSAGTQDAVEAGVGEDAGSVAS